MRSGRASEEPRQPGCRTRRPMHRPIAPALIVVTLLLAGCIDTGVTPPAEATAPASASSAPASAPASAAESATATPPASVEPVPSADLGSFSCDLPVIEDATVALANITDVRVGTHA